MNKTKLSINILCLLILGIMIFSFAVSTGRIIVSALSDTQGNEQLYTDRIFFSAWVEKDVTVPTVASDTIHTTSGVSVPIIQEKVSFGVPGGKVGSKTFVTQTVLICCSFVLSILMLISFAKFVLRINNGHIFDTRNVRLLRNIGIYLITQSVIEMVSLYLDYNAITSTFGGIMGYTPTLWPGIPWLSVVLGLAALVMSLVWKRGLALKQDNELTI